MFRYLNEHFVPVLQVDPFGFWVHRGRPVALFSIARVLPTPVAEHPQLEFTVEAWRIRWPLSSSCNSIPNTACCNACRWTPLNLGSALRSASPAPPSATLLKELARSNISPTLAPHARIRAGPPLARREPD